LKFYKIEAVKAGLNIFLCPTLRVGPKKNQVSISSRIVDVAVVHDLQTESVAIPVF
jgi:hypothetical protein